MKLSKTQQELYDAMKRGVRVRYMILPVIRIVTAPDVWEHTPICYARGEYPRHIRPVGPRLGDHQVKFVRKKP